MWSCASWPTCAGAINIEPRGADLPAHARRRSPLAAGRSLQARFEEERAAFRLKRRAYLPLLVGTVLVLMAILFVAFLPMGGPIAGVVAALAGGTLFTVAVGRLPPEAMAWARGAEGERAVARWLEPLEAQGYVALHGRRIPGQRGDIDHLVVGPTGVFVIETKNWSGKVEVIADRLFVGDHDRTWSVRQLYREAIAVQIALGDRLGRHHVTVTPLLCVLGGTSGRSHLGGVAVVGRRELVRTILGRPQVLGEDAVLDLARVADERLPLVRPWEAQRR